MMVAAETETFLVITLALYSIILGISISLKQM